MLNYLTKASISYLVKVFHDIFPTRLKICNERNLIANLLKIIKSQLNANRPAKIITLEVSSQYYFITTGSLASNFTHLAIAIKCSTALVDPPSAITITIALRSDLRVMISRGFKSIFSNSSRYFPANRHSSNFSGSSAGVDELQEQQIKVSTFLKENRRETYTKLTYREETFP